MDLGAHLANLSLAEIASMLNTKQQEVLLASISVAARFIQQLQAEEQLHQTEEQLQQTEEQLQLAEDQILHHEEQQQQQHHQQQQLLQLHQPQPQTTHLHHHHSTKQERKQDIQLHHQTQHNLDSQDNQDDLQIIAKFAEELKHRRKSIRLSQKGAAQSLRAFTGGEQPCTDAIIYHFENLQLEPDRAMQLIPLLRNWLEWAEKHRLNGRQLPMMSAVTKVPRERKRKVVLFNEKAKQYLEDAFLKNNHPDRYQLDVISQELNIPTRSIRKWFTNRRQRKRFAEKFSPVS